MSTRTFTFNVTAPQTGWIPAPGTFKDISTNTLFSARPANWPTGENAGPFANWSGGVYAPEFGAAGAYIIHGSGHLSPPAPLWAGVWVFDIASLSWVGRNVPSEPLRESTLADWSLYYNDYLESVVPATAGHPYPPHTYDGLIYQPPALGGGSSGSLIRNCFAGSGKPGSLSVHRFDLSSTTAPPTRVINSLSGVSTSYPMAAYDAARGGYWALSYNGAGALSFVSLPSFAVSTYARTFNDYGGHNMLYVPTRDCLVAIGPTGSGGVNMNVRVCPIVGGVPQAWTVVTQSGTPPSDRRCGGVWSTLLNCIVSYNANGSYEVHKLAVPADLTGGVWTWSSETLIGVGGAVPCKNTAAINGAWSRFVEAPEHNCFIWCDSILGPVQAWRLTGM